ncbi:MAG: phosphoadenylyl-sulfate reductase [Bacteroidota bacterium]
MTFDQIEKRLKKYESEGKRLFTTSSFQSHSLVLLHMLSRMKIDIPVVFINTGYHFAETVAFKDRVSREFGLKVMDLRSDVPKFMQRSKDGRLLFASDPDHCCYLNKTQPVDSLLMRFDVWINGVRADQSAVRNAMKVEQQAPHDAIRFHPMLDWNAKMIYTYQKEYNLPKHPLESNGYLSLGCEPCTRKIDPDMMEREARWFGMKKVECGLHTDLVEK